MGEINRPGPFARFFRTILFIDILKGMALTLSYFFKPKITYQYPEEQMPIPDRYRGLHEMRRWADGTERCVACGLCAAVCPSNCIYIEPGENERGERYPAVYEINIARCIFCGFCIEVCPYEAIRMTGKFELATYDLDDCLYTKDRLLLDKGEGVKPTV